MTNEEIQFQRLADNIMYYIEEKQKSQKNDLVRFFRAKVTAAASNGKITVKRPFDSSELALPYVSTMENAAVGDSVYVLVFGSLSNAAIFCYTNLSNM